MKYLKEYNQHDLGFKMVDPSVRYSTALEVEDFKNIELDQISSELKSKYAIDYNYSEILGINRVYIRNNNYTVCEITKIRDDWFILVDMTKSPVYYYYKCDQIDGVLNCLKKIGLIK
jgi:hypothetical protein